MQACPLAVADEVARFDLELDLGEEGGKVRGGLKYATSLFERSTIERHAGYLRRVLEGMAGDEEQEVDGIELLSAEERHRLLVEWNATAAAVSGARVHSRSCLSNRWRGTGRQSRWCMKAGG